MDWKTWIERRRTVMSGKPVAVGTRITVELILQRLGDGWTGAALLESFPQLRAEHIRAAQAYAAASLAGDEVIDLSSMQP